MRMNSRNYYSVNMVRAIVVANQRAARVKTLAASDEPIRLFDGLDEDENDGEDAEDE